MVSEVSYSSSQDKLDVAVITNNSHISMAEEAKTCFSLTLCDHSRDSG